MSIFITAEIGINHNGDINTAKRLIDLAIKAGCDAVKFQKRTIDKVYTQEYLDCPRESPWGKTQRSQKEGLEFGKKEYKEIDNYCREKGIDWFASAWDVESQKFLRQFNLRYNKIASAMIVSKELLREVASEGIYTFISTGMSTLSNIEDAVRIFKVNKCPFELMHCVSTYPMNPELANLNCMKTLRDIFHCGVGYSGHEHGLAISYAAAALGATSIERHITLNRAMYGSDQAVSVGPAGLHELVGAIRKIEQALGSGEKMIIEEEKKNAKKLRGHLL